MTSFGENPEETIIREIEKFVSLHPGNRKPGPDGIPYYDTPLVGFADVNDNLFSEFKDIIGDFHLTPVEVLARSFPEHTASWDGSSVISWIIPVSRSVRESNRKETRCSSKTWMEAKLYGEELNIQLQEHLVSFIHERGFFAIPPILSPFFEVLQLDKVSSSSNWSERHVAYAAGLGTFGLSGGLITTQGIAMRCASVVTSLKLNPTKRSYSDFQEHCLFYNSDTCGRCRERCPSGAISQEGHNKELCMVHCAQVMQECDYNAGVPSCGLCQTAVPCEAGIPKKSDK
jgi:epoxyqueuosine reductase